MTRSGPRGPVYPRFSLVISGLLAVAATLLWGGCGPADKTPPRKPAVKRATSLDLSFLQPTPVGAPIGQPPWIGHVNTVDLDADGLLDVLACESQDNTVLWVRQSSKGVFEERVVGKNLRAPVHVEAGDVDSDGDLDLIVSSMSFVFPNNDRIGMLYVLENDGRCQFTVRTILENTERVVDARPADLNGDGRTDLVLAQFGYDQGLVSWLEQTAPWKFERRVLLDLSGSINIGVADFNADKKPDVVALISQQWEEVYYFENQGGGQFTPKRIWGSTNEDYGSSGLTVADLNRDGRPDVIHTNGDGFGPAATPGPRPWHGVQWLENVGNGLFRAQRIASLPGAYSPVVVDMDADGAMDIVCSTAYADWNNQNRDVVSLVWYRNDGRMNFEARVLAKNPKDLITVAAGDFDASGKPWLVTGGFYIYPPYDSMGRLLLWRR
jgi:hypothetical protein